MFHGNFWSNIEMDFDKGTLVEKKNLISSSDSLYNMTDPEWMYAHLKDDLAMQMALYKSGEITDIDFAQLRKLAHCLRVSADPEKQIDKRKAVGTLLDTYAFAATKYLLEKVKAFAATNNKKLLVVVFDPYQVTRPLLQGQPRYDQPVVDFLKKNKINYFDMNLVHVEDYKSFKVSIDDYFKRYFIGHYNPAGNHFFAFSIKPKIIEMLDPKPITYQKVHQQLIGFKGYLEGF